MSDVTTYPFLSDEWIEAARELRARYAEDTPGAAVAAKVNVVVTDIAHRDGDLEGHIDTTGGQAIIEHGHLPDSEMTITVPYSVARAAFIDQDQQAVMQAFFSGQILLEGDPSKLMQLMSELSSGQTPEGLDGEAGEKAVAIYDELLAFTADD